MTAVGFSSIFPFLPLYVKSLGSSTGMSVELMSGLVFSSQAFTMMIASPIWGILADRYGRKLMVERALFGGAVLLLLMAFVRTAEELVIVRAIQGLITGSVAASSALLASQAPRQRMGYAMGVLQVGLGAGIAVGPLIGGAIADTYGYSSSFYVPAVLLMIAGGLVLFGVQEQFVRPKEETSARKSLLSQWRVLLLTPGILMTLSMRFMTSLGRMTLLPLVPFFVEELMHTTEGLNTFTGLVIGITSATTTISSIFLGKLGDRIGHRLVLIVSMLLAAGLYAVQSLITAGWQLLVFQAFVGVAVGGIIPMISALLANFIKFGEVGAVYGLDNSINAAGRAVAPLIGALVANRYGLRATFITTGLIFLIASFLAMWRLPKTEG
ncbi:MAG: MFS transporter [Anaerolineales bacterium]|nr:MFS transporter [Chloroflexota bacterium]MBL7163915.1 MFS transporter [Anaerolineales bacterium]